MLALSETASRKYAKAKVKHPHHLHTKYPPGMEWEILNADAVVLLGLTNALRFVRSLSLVFRLIKDTLHR